MEEITNRKQNSSPALGEYVTFVAWGRGRATHGKQITFTQNWDTTRH